MNGLPAQEPESAGRSRLVATPHASEESRRANRGNYRLLQLQTRELRIAPCAVGSTRLRLKAVST